MDESINFSSKKVLQELIERPERGVFDAEAIYQMGRDIATSMEQFDLEKNKKLQAPQMI